MNAPSRRQIVVCCDGTNNTLTGGAQDTNVLQLHTHLARQPPKDGFERILYYDPGVGSPGVLPPAGPTEWLSRAWSRMAGLASGSGVYENIAAAYLFLMHHWRDNGDLIYLFGFSRGAFTVRAVAGMVNLFGIVRPEYEELVPTLVHIYFSPTARTTANPLQRATRALHRRLIAQQLKAQSSPRADIDERGQIAEQVRTQFAGPGRSDAWVHWVGVWDTVESVGLPGPLSRVNPTPPTFVGKRYRHVRHALCLDEHRWAFQPRLYEEPADVDMEAPPAPPFDGVLRQTLKQRWYSGVHCDVGGGYPREEAALPDAALRWMVDEVASDLGIAPIATDFSAALWRHDPLWDTPWWALAGMTVRDMHPKFRSRPDSGRVHFQAIPAPNMPEHSIHTVWELPRPVSSALTALILGLVFLLASGLCLLGRSELLPKDWMTGIRAVQAAQDFADQQLAALWFQGVFAAGHRPWELAVQPGWAMLWDLAFIACWAYLLARVCSRAFAWLAGDRFVNSKRPWWLPLGFAPLVAVAGDVAEDLSLWIGLALHWSGTDIAALLVLWIGGLAALVKLGGLAACAALGAIRCRILFNPGRLWPDAHPHYADEIRRPQHLHHIGDAVAAAALAISALALWSFSRLTICWGSYNWFGSASCHAHLVAVLLALLAFVPFVRFARDLVRPRMLDHEGRRIVSSRTMRDGMREVGAFGVSGAGGVAIAQVLLVVLLVWLLAMSKILF